MMGTILLTIIAVIIVINVIRRYMRETEQEVPFQMLHPNPLIFLLFVIENLAFPTLRLLRGADTFYAVVGLLTNDIEVVA